MTESFELKPRYTTAEVPGKCIKCLAEQELNNCLMELLRGDEKNKKSQQRFEMLVSFLKSPESQKLRDESERYLAEGKEVKVRLYFVNGELKCELKLS